MKSYTLYFSIFGKKMKHTLKADNEIEAKMLIREKVLFHKIEVAEGRDMFDFLKDIVNK